MRGCYEFKDSIAPNIIAHTRHLQYGTAFWYPTQCHTFITPAVFFCMRYCLFVEILVLHEQ